MNLRNLGELEADGGLGGLSDENLNEARNERVKLLARMLAVWGLQAAWSMVTEVLILTVVAFDGQTSTQLRAIRDFVILPTLLT